MTYDRYDHFEDILPPEEEEEINREQRLREKAFFELETRDDELKRMRDGNFPDKRKPMQTPETKDEAFKNYMKLYYNKPRLTVSLWYCSVVYYMHLFNQKLHEIVLR